VIPAQKKRKLVLLKNIVRTVKKSYAQNVLNGICGVMHLALIDIDYLKKNQVYYT
jgi:hypothetical protein